MKSDLCMADVCSVMSLGADECQLVELAREDNARLIQKRFSRMQVSKAYRALDLCHADGCPFHADSADARGLLEGLVLDV